MPHFIPWYCYQSLRPMQYGIDPLPRGHFIARSLRRLGFRPRRPHSRVAIPRHPRAQGAFEFNDFTKVTIAVDQAVRLDTRAGYALLTGTMKCTRDETILLRLELRQDQKERGL